MSQAYHSVNIDTYRLSSNDFIKWEVKSNQLYNMFHESSEESDQYDNDDFKKLEENNNALNQLNFKPGISDVLILPVEQVSSDYLLHEKTSTSKILLIGSPVKKTVSLDCLKPGKVDACEYSLRSSTDKMHVPSDFLKHEKISVYDSSLSGSSLKLVSFDCLKPSSGSDSSINGKSRWYKFYCYYLYH